MKHIYFLFGLKSPLERLVLIQVPNTPLKGGKTSQLDTVIAYTFKVKYQMNMKSTLYINKSMVTFNQTVRTSHFTLIGILSLRESERSDLSIIIN